MICGLGDLCCKWQLILEKVKGIYIQVCGRERLDNRRKLKSENHKRRNYIEGPVGDSIILTL
jgi:hypothetical protein